MEPATAVATSVAAQTPRRISILGATGSIGCSTLDLIGRDPQRYDVVALTALNNADQLARQAIEHDADLAVLGDPDGYQDLKAALSGTNVEAAAGPDALVEAAERPADWTMAAIMGCAGLRPTLKAVEQGRCLALANKECLVSAGDLFMKAVSRSGTQLLPVDSEHSAAFQAIDPGISDTIEKISLTASGGPFRTWTHEQMKTATPQDALKHPTWSMGKKLTIDSATLMNKGLELIEAFHLFPVEAGQLDVVIHPQSIVHCLVEYADGSVLAQMSSPDMRTPIAYSLAWPERMWAPTERLDLAKIGSLEFESPDKERFPALSLTQDAMQADNGTTTVLNAANEIAVEAFLEGKIGFPAITALVMDTIDAAMRDGISKPDTLDDVFLLDEVSRGLAQSLLSDKS
ncbi:MAG: 1-deoxy-D-xylulose-5-phosphate reductoisomerase [Hyphomicrobiaceae bacterium]|nr:1-deoxy-D-xylulose-5-phosphate reductoisomerase [Hyphomicrobiaceae bacterium]